MPIEQYSLEVMVVAASEKPSPFKVWLRKEAGADFASDLRWLCEEYMDSHVIVDLAAVSDLNAATQKLVQDLRTLVEDSDYRLVLCGLTPQLKRQLDRARSAREFGIFDTRKAALRELAPQEAHDDGDPATAPGFAVVSTPPAGTPAAPAAAPKRDRVA